MGDNITTIISTCCRKSAPCCKIIKTCIQNLKNLNPELIKNLIIVFDGAEIKNPNKLHFKCKDCCDKASYNIYKENVKIFTKELLKNNNIKFIDMPERSGLSTGVKRAIEACKTEFIHIVQEDLVLIKKINTEVILRVIKEHPKIKLVRLAYNSNKFHENWIRNNIKKNKFVNQTTCLYNQHFSISNLFSDNNHITTKEYYNKFVIPNIPDYSFMEYGNLQFLVGELETIWYLGDYNDGNYIKHLNGRSN